MFYGERRIDLTFFLEECRHFLQHNNFYQDFLDNFIDDFAKI